MVERPFRSPAFVYFLAALAGAGVAETVKPVTVLWLVALALASVAALWTARRQWGTALACGLVCATAFAARVATVEVPAAVPECGPLVDAAESASGRRFRATIEGPIGREPAPLNGMRLRLVLRLTAEACGGLWMPRDARVGATLDAGADLLASGDTLELRATIRPLPLRRAPGQPTPQARARRQQRVGTARVFGYAVVSRGHGVASALERWRQRTAQRFEEALPPSTQALGKALAIGDQAGIDRITRQAWADAGTAHLLSVSGLHVALVAWLLRAVALSLVRRLPHVMQRFGAQRPAVALALPGVLAYGLVTGGSPAAWRATLMACAALVAGCCRRDVAATDALGLAGLALLAVTPMAIYDPGFWLSFAAVGALLALPRQSKPEGRWHQAWATVRLGLMVSLAASIATAPLTIWYFGRVSLMGPFTNLVAAPVGSWAATPLALALALCGAWPAGLQSTVAWLLHQVLAFLDRIAQCTAALPFAAFDVAWPTLPAWPASTKAVGMLVVQHIYVGHGDATLVRMPHGEVMLVDGGGAVGGAADPGEWAVLPALRAAAVERIDVMVATHPHPDHINGLLAVAQRYDVRAFWYNGTGASLPVMAQLIDTLRARGTDVRDATTVPPRAMHGAVQIERVHPTSPLNGHTSANDNSVVLRLQYGARSLLLTGDIEAWAESEVARKVRPTDIMKVPHHGSRTSSTQMLLRAVQPQLAVVSCGAENRWGFPHADVRARYDAAAIRLWRTDTHGEITATTDGKTWDVQSLATGERLTINPGQ